MSNSQKFINYLCFALILTLVFYSGDAWAEGDGNVLTIVKNRSAKIIYDLKPAIFVLGGFGLIGFAFAAIFGKISWKWFAHIAIGLFLVSNVGLFIDYFVSNDGTDYAKTALGYGNYLDANYKGNDGAPGDPNANNDNNLGSCEGADCPPAEGGDQTPAGGATVPGGNGGNGGTGGSGNGNGGTSAGTGENASNGAAQQGSNPAPSGGNSQSGGKSQGVSGGTERQENNAAQDQKPNGGGVYPNAPSVSVDDLSKLLGGGSSSSQSGNGDSNNSSGNSQNTGSGNGVSFPQEVPPAISGGSGAQLTGSGNNAGNSSSDRSNRPSLQTPDGKPFTGGFFP